MSKKKPYIFTVSTKPDITSYKWAGTEISILSTVILWTIWLCRLLSIYQHIKAIMRIISKRKKAAKSAGADNGKRKAKGKIFGVTNKSGRPDIPPMTGELYFIVWTVLFSLAHAFHWDGLGWRIAMIYYLFESCVWIFYYTVFRRFFEIGYSIYHKLEYLTAMFLIIPTQALCFAKLYGMSFRAALMGLLGGAPDGTPFPVVILGCLFSAIVISMIISTFPMESIKKTDTRPNMYVVGCGDVVKERLYPAITKGGRANKLAVYDLNSAADRRDYCTYLEDQAAICEAINRRVTDKDIVWIETPSFAHVGYLERLLKSDAKLIVVEKPISVIEDELKKVEELVKDPQTRNRLFFLSYYTLEKALPLHFLTHAKDAHEKYLDIDDASLIKNWRIQLGALKSAEVHICEGTDDRGWVYEKANGGHLLETFLHNVLIASLVCGDPRCWTDVQYNERQTETNAHVISLSAKHGMASIELYQEKNAPAENGCRYANFRFAHGSIEMDMDTKMATVYFEELDERTTLSVKQDFEDRYSVMVSMATAVAAGEYSSAETDGYANQISTIRWLMSLKDN